MRISVIIPTLNEAGTIRDSLASLTGQGADEVIVADAASLDGTAAIAGKSGANLVLQAPRGRASQQNAGAAASEGDVLLFLHADCRLGPGGLGALRSQLAAHPKAPGGCFRMRVDHASPVYRLIETAADARAGLLGLPYGDQAIFARRDCFDRVGGFPRLPLMEDLYFAASLRRLGRLLVLPRGVIVSPRRWEARGVARQSLLNWSLTAAAAAGVPPSTLARYYSLVR